MALFSFGCEKSDSNALNDNALTVQREIKPVLSLVYDHEPTSKELLEDAFKSMGISKDLPNNNNFEYPNAMHEKLVILVVKTADYKNAGTDKAASCRFIGRWVNELGNYKTEYFILDNTNRDDLNRNSCLAFYYFYNESNNTDRFISGRLKNSSSDGWLCEYVKYTDYSCSGSRETYLFWGDPNNDWVQSDGTQLSSEKFSQISTWLNYTNCSN